MGTGTSVAPVFPGDDLLRSYLTLSPYPVFLYACELPHPSPLDLDLLSAGGPFNLQSSCWSNQEAGRATGGRDLWKCLPPESRISLRFEVEKLCELCHVGLNSALFPAPPLKDGVKKCALINLFTMVMVQTPSNTVAEMREVSFSLSILPRPAGHRGHLLALTALMGKDDLLTQPERPSKSRTSSTSSAASCQTISVEMPPRNRRRQSTSDIGGSPGRVVGSMRPMTSKETSATGSSTTGPGDFDSRGIVSEVLGSPSTRELTSALSDLTPSGSASGSGSSSWRSGDDHASNSSEASEDDLEDSDSLIDQDRPIGYNPPGAPRPRPITHQEALAMIEMSPVAMVLSGRDAKIVYANPLWYDLCGITPGNAVDEWRRNVSDDHLESLVTTIMDSLSQKRRGRFEFKWKSGSWCELLSEPHLDEDGDIEFIVAALTDCTNRKRLELLDAENARERELVFQQIQMDAKSRELELAHAVQLKRQLDRSTQEFAKLANLATVGLCSLNGKGEIAWSNQAFYEIHDLTAATLHDWDKAIHDEDRPGVMQEWQRCEASQIPMNSRHRLSNGKTVQINSAPFIFNPGDSATWIASVTDVSAQVASEREVQRLSEARVQESLKAADEAEARRQEAVRQKAQQGLLVDVVSHELRNGISPILHSAMLVRASLLEFQKVASTKADTGYDAARLLDDIEACDAVIDSANAMERVANDVLGLAQIQLNQLVITPVSFNILQTLKTVSRIFQADCRAKDVQLSMELGSISNETTVVTDPQRLQQLIVNLLTNAIKFVTGGKQRNIVLRATLSTEKPGDEEPIVAPIAAPPPSPGQTAFLYISVSDTGPGMTPDQVSKLFQKWTQASPSVHIQSGGSGLGLFVSRRLCTLLHGRIDVVSEPGVGSTFRFYVTVEIPSVLENTPAVPDARMEAGTAMKVLVVDDNIVNRKILKRQLSQEGHIVKLAEDGQQALAAISDAQSSGEGFDCVILDVNMPVLNGLECARKVRADEAARGEDQRLRIIGCTGNARQAQMDAAVEAGMDAVVTKPYRLPELLSLIRRVQAEVIEEAR